MKKALFIGGTGIISRDVVRRLCALGGWDITLLNRGSRVAELRGEGLAFTHLPLDVNDEGAVAQALTGKTYDVVCDFIVFTPAQAARDIRLFTGKTGQYVFISTASAYHKPVPGLPITESTPLHNPFWAYSRDKIACEDLFIRAYRDDGFPVTIVRPSHTYNERSLPLQIHGDNGPWATIQRMLAGKTVPLCADGMTLWTTTTAADFAVYFCGLLGNPQAVGEAFHITSDESLTWNAMYQSLCRTLGVPFNPCYVPAGLLARSGRYDFRGALLGDKANTVIFDNTKVRRVTGIPALRFTRYDEGAARSLEWLLTHPAHQLADPAYDAFCDRVEAVMEAAREELGVRS